MNAIEQVKKKLEEESMDTEDSLGGIGTSGASGEDQAFVDLFDKRGRKQHRSGKCKVVSYLLF